MKEAIKLVIEDTFSPAIDFRAPYAKLMLDRVAEKIAEILAETKKGPGGDFRAFQGQPTRLSNTGKGASVATATTQRAVCAMSQQISQAPTITDAAVAALDEALAGFDSERAWPNSSLNIWRAVLAAIEAAGYAVVPLEPTPEMMARQDPYSDWLDRNQWTIVWQEMLAARPR
jgi:hypothetical protein